MSYPNSDIENTEVCLKLNWDIPLRSARQEGVVTESVVGSLNEMLVSSQ